MKDFPVPVVGTVPAIGPGSQPADDELNYTPYSRDVPTFEMPRVPTSAPVAHVKAAHDVMQRFLAEFDRPGTKVEMTRFHPGALKLVDEALGEGEVAIRIARPDGSLIRITETVFAGVWREHHLDPAGALRHDYLEVCPLPPVVVEAAEQAGLPQLAPIAVPPGAMNSPALLAELRERIRGFQPEAGPHVINLTLLPLTPEDHEVIAQAVPDGPVAILSRGFGNCRISSTGLRHVWRVQYFNNMQTMILNTLEIVRVPEVTLAAAEDLADSRERLEQLLEWMAEDLPA